MKLQTSTIFWTFLWCLFMGVTAISIGFGALFPSMNRIAKPFVCPSGTMNVDEQVYNPYPGNTITTLTWYCVDATTGTKTELGIFPMSLYSGLIYGFLLFVVVFIVMLINANKSEKTASKSSRIDDAHVRAILEQTQDPPTSPRVRQQDDLVNSPSKVKASENALARMKELKELRMANLISETEYEEKRARF